MRPQLAIHPDNDSVKATEFRHSDVDQASRPTFRRALLNVPNDQVEQLAANRLTIPQDDVASLLERLVQVSRSAAG